jgi:hypothetical protein
MFNFFQLILIVSLQFIYLFIEYILLLYWHNYWIICWIVILNVEFTLGLVIEYVGIISIDWVNWLWLLLTCAGLWIWIVSSIEEVLSNFFLTFEFNYIIICIKLCRMKTRAGRSRTVATSSSSSDDNISLGASQEEALTPLVPSTDAASPSVTSQCRGGVPSQRNQFTRKRHNGRTTFQCKFVKVLIFFLTKITT